MTETPVSAPSALDQVANDSVYGRVFRFMAAIVLAATPVFWVTIHGGFAIGFLVGSFVSALNLYWLRQAIERLGEQAARSEERGSAIPFLARYFFRFSLIAAVTYVIFKGSPVSVYGLFAGLFLPVAAMMCEAVYESWIALRNPG
jgi:hypothetical protein